ncbi:MAG: hypothetical protein ACRC8Y_20860 [Chroococcales cyanobacterium]
MLKFSILPNFFSIAPQAKTIGWDPAASLAANSNLWQVVWVGSVSVAIGQQADRI